MSEVANGLMQMDRRSMIAQIAMLIGAAALPAEALAAAPARRARRFLAAPQLALLAAVADTIIPATDSPGAIAAGVPLRIDGLLTNWASADTRTLLTGALTRIDSAAIAQKGKRFAALSVADRVALLRPYDAAALKKAAPPPNAPKANPYAPINYVADPGYLKLKELVINLYYFSETATAHELIYEHVPGEWQPSIKLTPQSRPYLGNGPF
jgi:gluconate 2-dehydrogenase gamma chain